MWLKMLYVYLCVCFSIQPSQNLSLISSHLSLNCKGCWGTTEDFTTSWYGMVACIHHLVSGVQSTTWQSPSLSRLNTWPSSSSWNPSAHLALFFKLWSYPPSDVMLAPAISPITGRLVEGRSVLFLPVRVQRTCPLPTNICVDLWAPVSSLFALHSLKSLHTFKNPMTTLQCRMETHKYAIPVGTVITRMIMATPKGWKKQKWKENINIGNEWSRLFFHTVFNWLWKFTMAVSLKFKKKNQNGWQRSDRKG